MATNPKWPSEPGQLEALLKARSCLDWDIGQAYHALYSYAHEYRLKERKWYFQNENGFWELDKDQSVLRKCITGEFVGTISLVSHRLYLESVKGKVSEELVQGWGRLINKLKTYSYKNTLILQLKEQFGVHEATG